MQCAAGILEQSCHWNNSYSWGVSNIKFSDLINPPSSWVVQAQMNWKALQYFLQVNSDQLKSTFLPFIPPPYELLQQPEVSVHNLTVYLDNAAD